MQSEMFTFCFLLIILIGSVFSLIYAITKNSEEKIFTYLRHISFCVSVVSFGFCIIITIMFLIALMTKITMALLGY
nr:MAG TPA: hypothetical protein [Caudoviricetes sp.]